jgi:hypothetical protein
MHEKTQFAEGKSLVAQQEHTAAPPAGSSLVPGVVEAMANLRSAVEAKKVEPICSAYETLRSIAHGMGHKGVVALADRALGVPSVNVIVSAYSHRHCFMCSGGTVPCDICNGAGRIAENRSCPHCEGFAVAACSFCRGTGWADRQSVPSELRAAVLDRQRAHVNRELQQLDTTLLEAQRRPPSQLDASARNSIIAAIFEVQARLGELSEAGVFSGPEKQAKLQALTEKLDKRLQAYKR